MKRTLYTSFTSLMMIVVLTQSACFGSTDDDNKGSTEPLTCMDAVDVSGELFLSLDVSCTQDSDCTVTERGVCGCPLALNKSADIEGYRAAIKDVKATCDESVSDCSRLECLMDVTAETVICNAQKRCDQPPAATN